MKKRLLSVFLALALCMGLAVPAIAADCEVPTGSCAVDLDAPDLAEMGVDGEFMARYLNSSRSYDERLVVRESGKYVPAPCEEKYTPTLAQVSGRRQSAGTFASMPEERGGKLSKDNSGVITLAISSDSLCGFFGGSTLFEWDVMKNGADVVAKGAMLFAAGEPAADPVPDNSADPGAPVPEFTDLPGWCAKEAQWAAQEGITKGDGSETTFAPDKVCSRGHIACFLYRAYNN